MWQKIAEATNKGLLCCCVVGGTSETTTTSTPPHSGTTSSSPPNWSQRLAEEVVEKWNRPPAALVRQMAKDLPRLVPMVQVYEVGGTSPLLLKEGNAMKQLLELLFCLAEQVQALRASREVGWELQADEETNHGKEEKQGDEEEEKEEEDAEKNIYENLLLFQTEKEGELNTKNGVEEEMLTTELLEGVVGFESKVGRLLRTCTQGRNCRERRAREETRSYLRSALGTGHIAPCSTELKMVLGMEFLTKDCPGGWSTSFLFHPSCVEVRTMKREQGLKEDFQLEWRLTVIFDQEIGCIQESKFAVVNVDMKNMKNETKRRLTAILASYMTHNES
ncbi:hypothetical protein QOT17_006891 [Balamuthia mandrillaris]